MFDEQPDGDPHGECAAEIRRLQVALQSFMFDFGQFDSDEERLAEFRRLRKAARPLLAAAGVIASDDAQPKGGA